MTFNPKDLLPKSSTTSTTATKLSGVGSSRTKTQQQNNISEDWTKFGKRQILSIGNKKRHHNQQVDIEEDDNIDVGESSSDEEEGRTSAVREKKKRKVVAKVSSTHQTDVSTITTTDGVEGVDSTVNDIIPNTKKKKKKKKGKKERAKDNNNKDTSIEQQSLDNENTTDAQQSVAKEVVASDEDADETSATKNSISNTNDTSNTTTATNTTTKRKRKKVRSRQKNIRKDNREVKPSHLIIGNEDYKGRPMTKETCEKLGIQSKKSEDGKKNLKRKGIVDALFDSGEWVGSEDKTDITTNDDETAKNTTGEEDIKQPKEDVEGDTLTRIGDCIVGSSSNIDNDDDTNKDDVGENILNADSKKKKGKKQKKRKFKNLVVG